VASPATRDRDRLHLRRLRAEVLVAREHRAPEGVRARVRDVAGPALVEALRRAAPAALGELRPGVWLLRRLALTFEIDAGWDAATDCADARGIGFPSTVPTVACAAGRCNVSLTGVWKDSLNPSDLLFPGPVPP